MPDFATITDWQRQMLTLREENENLKKRIEAQQEMINYLSIAWSSDKRISGAASALSVKLHRIKNDKGFLSMFTMATIHGVPYSGPTWVEELTELDKALDGE